jgi:hypothetical protein
MEPVDTSPPLPSYRLFSPPADGTDDSARKRAWKGDEFSFRDILDVINPLQHLPVISTLYRWITGDTIGALPRIVGDGLYGGPIGLVAGLFNAQVKEESGKDVGEQVIAALGGDTSAPAADAPTVAANETKQDGGPPLPTDARRAEGTPIVAPASTETISTVAANAPVAAPVAGPVQPVAASAGHPPPALTPEALTARIGLRKMPGMPPAAAATDPRAAFLARASALHRDIARNDGSLPGRALSNTPVPLQGIALPASVLRASATAPAPPGAKPMDISQQMMDALDKYARLQQQRDAQRDNVRDKGRAVDRGGQVDLIQ